MPAMEWTDQFELGLAKMDATHREFVDLYNVLAAAAPEARLQHLDAFIEHTEAHFGQENRWMELVSFPGCHRAEHDRVLAVMHDVRRRLAAGDTFLAQRLIEELPQWFETHASGMDAALAFHLDSIGFDVDSERLDPAAAGCGEGKSAGGCACATLSAQPEELPAAS